MRILRLSLFIFINVILISESWKLPSCSFMKNSFDSFELKKCISNALLISAASSLSLLLCSSTMANAVELENYSTTADYSFGYSSDFKSAPKLVKTHQDEVFYKSKSIKGFNAGLTVDPVKIKSLKEFASSSELENKLVAVEKGKEGVFEADIVSASENNKNNES